MTIGEIMEKLEIRMERMIRIQPEKKRLYFDKLKSKFDSRAILLYGPRGVGKTTFSLNEREGIVMKFILMEIQ